MAEEEKKERWLNYLALTTVILAVCATLSTFKGGAYSTKSVLSQNQAANQWAYFQSKSIKSYLYEIQKDEIELSLQNALQENNNVLAEQHRNRIALYVQKIKKYDYEKAVIMKEAKKLESIRDEAQRHSRDLGIAVIFLQIAILLSSISALMKKKLLWLCSAITGVVGIGYFVNGLFLII
jgi:hypothetical protein